MPSTSQQSTLNGASPPFVPHFPHYPGSAASSSVSAYSGLSLPTTHSAHPAHGSAADSNTIGRAQFHPDEIPDPYANERQTCMDDRGRSQWSSCSRYVPGRFSVAEVEARQGDDAAVLQETERFLGATELVPTQCTLPERYEGSLLELCDSATRG